MECNSNVWFQKYSGDIDFYANHFCKLIKHLDKNICVVYKGFKYYLFSKGFGSFIRSSVLTKNDRFYVYDIGDMVLCFNNLEEAIKYYNNEMYGGVKNVI